MPRRSTPFLGIPYRVVNICTGDIGTVAAKKYDIRHGCHRNRRTREVVSCSNRLLPGGPGTHQGPRCARFRIKAVCPHPQFNGRGNVRTIRAILENYQEEGGKVRVPEVLRPYMNGLEYAQRHLP